MSDPVTGFDASQYSLDASKYSFDPGEQGQYMRSAGYKIGAKLHGYESYEDWFNRNQSYLDRLYEQDSLAQQRMYEMYADSTRYQRLVEDLKKAGLNPWLALNGGSSSAGSVSVGSNSSNSARGSKMNNSYNNELAQVAKLFGTFLTTAFMVARFL